MNKTSVLILGGGVMQIPSIRIAREKGWTVIVAARDILDEIACQADYLEHVDLSDRKAVYDVAREYRERIGLNGVFTAGTDFSTTVAWVAEKLKLPGISYGVAQAATDKSLMRRIFREKEIPCPRFFTVNGRSPEPDNLRGFCFPLVVKPVDNMGARGVRRVDNEIELEAALAEALTRSRTARAIVEEYMEGPELSLDAIVFEGEISICGVADRHICFPPYFVEMGHTMPSRLDSLTLSRAVEVFKRGIRALGIDNGAAKGDIKITPSGPAVGEIAARLSGGYMSGWTFPLSSGIEVTEAALNIAVGNPPGDLKPKRSDTSAERAFISIPGMVAGMEGLDKVRSVPGVAELFLRTGKGKRVDFPIDNLGKCGNVISRAATRRQAVAAADRAVREILVRLEPANEDTDRFLFAPGPDLPRAFTLKVEKNQQVLDATPPAIGSPVELARAEKLPVMALPEIGEETERDWHGFTMEDALKRVLNHTGAFLVSKPPQRGPVLGSLFWKAFLGGSIQGGIYLIDTLRSDPKSKLLGKMLR